MPPYCLTRPCCLALVLSGCAPCPETPEVPDAWGSGLLLAALTGDGETNSGERAVTTTDKMWVQFGISIACTSGTPVQADITVILSIRQAT